MIVCNKGGQGFTIGSEFIKWRLKKSKPPFLPLKKDFIRGH